MKYNSIISNLFYGTLETKSQCKKCNQVKYKNVIKLNIIFKYLVLLNFLWKELIYILMPIAFSFYHLNEIEIICLNGILF